MAADFWQSMRVKYIHIVPRLLLDDWLAHNLPGKLDAKWHAQGRAMRGRAMLHLTKGYYRHLSIEGLPDTARNFMIYAGHAEDLIGVATDLFHAGDLTGDIDAPLTIPAYLAMAGETVSQTYFSKGLWKQIEEARLMEMIHQTGGPYAAMSALSKRKTTAKKFAIGLAILSCFFLSALVQVAWAHKPIGLLQTSLLIYFAGLSNAVRQKATADMRQISEMTDDNERLQDRFREERDEHRVEAIAICEKLADQAERDGKTHEAEKYRREAEELRAEA